MSAKWDRQWTRIGRYDKSRRRSTWARIEYKLGPYIYGFPESQDAVAIEMCSGREGDDAHVRVERGDPAFDALLNVIEYAIGNVDEEPDADESEQDVGEEMICKDNSPEPTAKFAGLPKNVLVTNPGFRATWGAKRE